MRDPGAVRDLVDRVAEALRFDDDVRERIEDRVSGFEESGASFHILCTSS
jgi:hypothetical protein